MHFASLPQVEETYQPLLKLFMWMATEWNKSGKPARLLQHLTNIDIKVQRWGDRRGWHNNHIHIHRGRRPSEQSPKPLLRERSQRTLDCHLYLIDIVARIRSKKKEQLDSGCWPIYPINSSWRWLPLYLEVVVQCFCCCCGAAVCTRLMVIYCLRGMGNLWSTTGGLGVLTTDT